jgi:hypothetical protein
LYCLREEFSLSRGTIPLLDKARLPWMGTLASCSGKSAPCRPGGLLVLQLNGGGYAQKTRWQYFLLLFALLPALLVLNSCGSSTPAAVPTISASCTNTSVNANAQSQCTAAISNLSSTLVTWQVNGTTGGGTTYGTIDTNGLYTAPAVQPTGALNIVTITAIAQAQTSLTSTVSITILAPASISAITCIDPTTQLSTTTATAGKSLVCTPTVAGGGNIAVFWYVSGSSACPTSASLPLGPLNGAVLVNGVNTYPCGQVVAAGNQMNFVPPQIPAPGATVTITAVSQADATQTLSLTVKLAFGNASLQGSYAFSMNGRISSGNTVRARVGSFTAANGQIIGGFEDIKPQPGTITGTPIQFSGTYSIGADGRGTMAFCEPSTSSCSPSGQTSQFRIVVDSAQVAQVIEFSPSNSSVALTVASGEMDLQPDTTSFNNAGFTGTYSFIGAGFSSPTAAESVAGVFSTNGSGLITSGEMDVNNVGGQAILTGSTYSISSNGRGTATIVTSSGTFNFTFYMVSSNRAKFMETDPAAILIGDEYKQQSIVSWGQNSLSGAYVFQTAGMGAGGEVTDLVSFTSAGNGTLTPGSVMIDDNNAGTVTSTSSLSGSYTFDVSGNGRGTLTIPGHSYVFYMISTGSAVIQETTPGIVAHGSMVQPAAGPFSLTSVEFSYALNLAGTDGSGKEQDFVGQLTTNGVGLVKSGSLDINDFGATQTGVSNLGTYAINTVTGRITMPLTQPQTLVLYLISPTQAFAMVGTDSKHTVASGSLYHQY